jgi:hypothetical protein
LSGRLLAIRFDAGFHQKKIDNEINQHTPDAITSGRSLS